MGDYTKLSKGEACEILNLYGIEGVEEIFSLSLGISNSNYKVTTKDKNYLLKVSNDKVHEDLRAEQSVLDYLAQLKYPYSLTAIKLLNGDNVYTCGDYFGVLFPFIDGIPPGPSDMTCQEIGRGMANLHTLKLDDNFKNIRSHEDVGFGADEIIAYVKSANAEKHYVELFNKVFPDQLEAYLSQDFHMSVIHGDLYADNTLFHQDHLAVVLDFEQAGRGKSILDIGISISGSCLEKGRVIRPLIDSFMKGYESVRKLEKNEVTYLNTAILIGLFSIAYWRIKRFTEGDLNPLMADSYKELLERALFFKVSNDSITK